jgi:hypothetical protein
MDRLPVPGCVVLWRRGDLTCDGDAIVSHGILPAHFATRDQASPFSEQWTTGLQGSANLKIFLMMNISGHSEQELRSF